MRLIETYGPKVGLNTFSSVMIEQNKHLIALDRIFVEKHRQLELEHILKREQIFKRFNDMAKQFIGRL